MEKKKLKYLWFLPLAVLGIYTLIFVFTSYSDRALNKYFVKNSKIGATEFVYFDGDSGYGDVFGYNKNYHYYVAKKRPNENSTEVYVVRNKYFLGWSELWSRYTPFAQGSDNEKSISSMLVTLRDDKGDKEPGATWIGFGSEYPPANFFLSYELENSDGEKMTLYANPHTNGSNYALRIHYNGLYDNFGTQYGMPKIIADAREFFNDAGTPLEGTEFHKFLLSNENDVFKISNVKLLDGYGKVHFEF